jgi:hypothetical protein
MSKPQHINYSITVFVVEGIKQAVLVSAVDGKLRQTHRNFVSPAAALAWARANHAGLVYSPASPSRN